MELAANTIYYFNINSGESVSHWADELRALGFCDVTVVEVETKLLAKATWMKEDTLIDLPNEISING